MFGLGFPIEENLWTKPLLEIQAKRLIWCSWRYSNENNEFFNLILRKTNSPDAEHSIRTDAPFFTCIWPPELMWWIRGGTKAYNVEKMIKNWRKFYLYQIKCKFRMKVWTMDMHFCLLIRNSEGERFHNNQYQDQFTLRTKFIFI